MTPKSVSFFHYAITDSQRCFALIQNSVSHNEDGCTIYVSVAADTGNCVICVEDDGIGATDEQIQKLNTTPHYMVRDENTTEQRHGLGLLIVKQIADSLHGEVSIEHSPTEGLLLKSYCP